jgi:hypothetical protein
MVQSFLFNKQDIISLIHIEEGMREGKGNMEEAPVLDDRYRLWLLLSQGQA